MKATVITIGTELLNGRTVNTNMTFIGKLFQHHGITIKRCLMIPDTHEDIISALDLSKNDSQIILMTGGLGPTNDDITKHVLCDYFGTELEYVPTEFDRIEHYFKSRNLSIASVNKNQAMYPKTCTILQNPVGTASGMHFEHEGVHYFNTPGVPHEMEYLLEHEILPAIKKQFHVEKLLDTNVYRTCSYSESKMYHDIEDIITGHPNLEFAFYPSFLCVDLKIRGTKSELQSIDAEIRSRLANYLFSTNEEESLQAAIGKKLLAQQATVSTAESCTGGLIAQHFTQTPGASAYFLGGIISYSNDMKHNELGVSPDVFETVGAVSNECVKQMAEGARQKFSSTYALSVSGIAGPTGGTDEKPVGTVFIGLATPSETQTFQYNFGNQREIVQKRSTIVALWNLWKTLS